MYAIPHFPSPQPHTNPPAPAQLLSVSLLTLATLTLTILLHTRHGLNPVLNVLLNSALALLWTVSFSLLAWWSASTLSSACAPESWDSDTGTRVCRTYKALFSFALLGTVGTLGAVALDVRVLRSSTRKGRFMSLGALGGKRGARAELDDVDDGIWDMNPPAMLAGRHRDADGYAVPEEQFGYADTGYGGAGELMERRSVGGRI